MFPPLTSVLLLSDKTFNTAEQRVGLASLILAGAFEMRNTNIIFLTV